MPPVQFHRLIAVATAASLAVAAGCSSQGLSPRETGMQTYSQVVYPAKSLPVLNAAGAAGRPIDMPPGPADGPVRIDLPARISVVQLGEIAPPDSMLNTLRNRPDLFTRVNAQTGFAGSADDHPHERLDEMRVMARNLGSQYLLVFGGNLDSGCQETGLSIFDLTIIGVFVVPSEGVAVSGKAAGSLIDVETGRVVMDFSADTEGYGLAPAAFAQNAKTVAEHDAEATLVKDLTEDVLTQLGGPTKTKVALDASEKSRARPGT